MHENYCQAIKELKQNNEVRIIGWKVEMWWWYQTDWVPQDS
jgi:hypothetical protein